MLILSFRHFTVLKIFAYDSENIAVQKTKNFNVTNLEHTHTHSPLQAIFINTYIPSSEFARCASAVLLSVLIN